MSSDVLNRLRQQIDEDVAREERRRKKRKKRKNSDYEDEEDRENVMPKWKMYLVGAAIFACFALLYPSVFSPILNGLLGRGGGSSSATAKHLNPNHDPRLQAPRAAPHRSHMHPAAAAAAQMRMPQAEAAQQSGRGGIFSWMLPIYTVGMVAFLLYTFFKPKKSKKKRRNRAEAMYLDDSTESDELDGPQLLGRRKLNSVQQRLQKTEAAMRQILEQLEGLANQADLQHNKEIVSNNHSDANATNTEQNLSPQQVKEMEKSLQELKILSDLCKEQRTEAQEAISEEEEGPEDDDQLPLTDESEEEEEEEEDELEKEEETDEKEEGSQEEQLVSSEPQPGKQQKDENIRKRIRKEK